MRTELLFRRRGICTWYRSAHRASARLCVHVCIAFVELPLPQDLFLALLSILSSDISPIDVCRQQYWKHWLPFKTENNVGGKKRIVSCCLLSSPARFSW